MDEPYGRAQALRELVERLGGVELVRALLAELAAEDEQDY